jgi:hypothetical protein
VKSNDKQKALFEDFEVTHQFEAIGAAVEGRLLARTAAITLDSNVITLPTS